MSAPVVFYAWQNDRPKHIAREFIREAADTAIMQIGAAMRVEDSPRLDHDTENMPGAPPIAETILRKIKHSAVFIADLTLCSELLDAEGKPKKKNPNPNVMLELGYAAAIMGWQRTILVMNEKYGGTAWLPFDLKNHRFPFTYELGPESSKGPQVRDALVEHLVMAIRACLMDEYDQVDATLARLNSHSRMLMKQFGASPTIWETTSDNRLLGRADFAIAQMLELNVLQCVDAIRDTGAEYAWTYLGQQCCKRLGAVMPYIPPLPASGVSPAQVFIDRQSLDCLRTKLPEQTPENNTPDSDFSNPASG